MRLKPVPSAPDDRERLREARRAVPLVPGSEDDCCARIQRRLDLPGRDDAHTWLTFLRALGLVRETARGYARTHDDLDWEAVAAAFRERTYAAREVLDALDDADGPRSVDEVFDQVDPIVPRWERHKDPAWRDTWRERVHRILDWAVLLDIATETDGAYALAHDVDP